MTDFERFAEALAKTESEDSEIAWGDPKHLEVRSYVRALDGHHPINGANFMAMGRWQIHPAWYHDWVPLKVPVDASWDEMFREALENFWNNDVGRGAAPLETAMRFHLGATALREGKWDEPYAERFRRAWAGKTEES